jgi:hypothetical protein
MEDKISNIKFYEYPAKYDTYSRVGHKAIQYGHDILVFGGINYHSDFTVNVFKINCENYQIETLYTKNSLSIEGFSLFSYKAKIYLWGGCGPAIVLQF